MKVVYSRCCGLDVHKDSVTACFVTGSGSEVRTFRTVTRDLPLPGSRNGEVNRMTPAS